MCCKVISNQVIDYPDSKIHGAMLAHEPCYLGMYDKLTLVLYKKDFKYLCYLNVKLMIENKNICLSFIDKIQQDKS